MPFIDRKSSVAYYQQLYDQIVANIENGILPAGKKLPSIRQTAKELGVSNTTVELAYQRLCEEGYAESRRGSGFIVNSPIRTYQSSPSDASAFSDEYQRDLEILFATSQKLHAIPEKVPFDFAYDAVDPTTFPFALWARATRDVLFSDSSHEACLYNDRQGLLDIRTELCRYVKTEYGVTAYPEQVVIGPTTREIILGFVGLFDPRDLVVAIEEPGYNEPRQLLERGGIDTRSLTVYPPTPWSIIERQIDGAKLVFLTPASQFPTNISMPDAVRRQFLKWAQDHDAYLIDDEYGFEFQHGSTHLEPIAALDTTGHTILIGTFSNTFTPALCMSWAILPPKLATKWIEAEHHLHPLVPWHTQKAMAELMRQDKLVSHVRKLRTTSIAKLDTLKHAIDRYFGPSVHVLNYGASPYILLKTNDGRSESELIEAAATCGVRVYPTSCYWNGPIPADWNYVLLGFARIPHAKINAGIRALATAWGVLR